MLCDLFIIVSLSAFIFLPIISVALGVILNIINNRKCKIEVDTQLQQWVDEEN